MRILCLHGHGTNPEILEYQISALRKAADPTWEFYMLAGEIECPPVAAELKSKFPGPFLCYTRRFDAEEMAAVYELIDEVIAEEGPFDGALGFSQGASVITSYLLEYAAANPGTFLPFRFAVLCSPTLPLAADPAYVKGVFGALSIEDQRRVRSCRDEELRQILGDVGLAVNSLAKMLDTVESIVDEPRSFFLDRPILEVPCVIHPDLFPTRLCIPTLHIRGQNEPQGLQECSLVVKSFFLPGTYQSLEHTAGHDMPRSEKEVRSMLSVMQSVIEKSQLPGV